MKWAEADKIKISPLTWVNKILLKHFTHLQLIVSTLNLGWALFWETKCSDKLSCQTVLCYSLIFITALLKRVLSADCCLWDDRNRWMALLLGFKRMFVSKKEILVTAATQCLIMIASNPKHSRVLQLVLEGDLSGGYVNKSHTTDALWLPVTPNTLWFCNLSGKVACQVNMWTSHLLSSALPQ